MDKPDLLDHDLKVVISSRGSSRILCHSLTCIRGDGEHNGHSRVSTFSIGRNRMMASAARWAAGEAGGLSHCAKGKTI
jgi:hypothetical protein